MSTKPGVTTSPAASTTRGLVSWSAGTNRPSRMPTSRTSPGAPVPSTTKPPEISVSAIGTVPPYLDQLGDDTKPVHRPPFAYRLRSPRTLGSARAKSQELDYFGARWRETWTFDPPEPTRLPRDVSGGSGSTGAARPTPWRR